MLVRIVAGIYGYVDKNGIIRPKTSKDSPFEVSDEEGQKLISLGVAQMAKQEYSAPVPDSVPGLSEPENGGSPEDNDGGDFLEYNSNMTVSELLSVAKEYGIEIPEKAKKAEILSILDKYFSDVPELTPKGLE